MITFIIVVLTIILYTVIAVGVYSFLEAREIGPYDARPVIGMFWILMMIAVPVAWIVWHTIVPAILWLDKKFQARFRR